MAKAIFIVIYYYLLNFYHVGENQFEFDLYFNLFGEHEMKWKVSFDHLNFWADCSWNIWPQEEATVLN